MDAGLLTIVAAGQMLVILTRNIDLSVASVIGLAAYVAADLLRSHPELRRRRRHRSPPAASGSPAACSTASSSPSAGCPSIVVTLGTLTLYRGLTSLYAGGKQVSADQVPQAWLDLTGASVAGVPGVVLIALATLARHRASCCADCRSAASSTPSARTRTAPQLIGIRVRRRVLGAFACCRPARRLRRRACGPRATPPSTPAWRSASS